MADVFISYSSRHKDITANFAVLLEKEGYSVWWDNELEAWSSYQQQIDQALAAASVIVVIWSEGAIGSLYVKAEANKALAAGKLVSARTPDLPFSAIPSPYNGMHIDVLDLADPHRLLRSIRGVWQGKPHITAKPLYEHYRETFGSDLFDPKRQPIDTEDSETLTPSDLLQARREAVRFIPVGDHLDELLHWCRDTSRSIAGRLVHGPGGYGKTRLLIEAALRLRAEGWLAGFLSPPRHPDDIQEMRQREQALEQVIAYGDEPGALLVMDYAEGRRSEIEEIASLIAGRSTEAKRPIRLALLARSDQWWKELHEQSSNLAVVFRASGRPLGDIRALGAIPEGQPRLDFFVDTVRAFEPLMMSMSRSGQLPGWNGRPPAHERLTRLMTQAAFARPLAIQMEALLYLASSSPDVETQGVDALLGRVLGLERKSWSKLLGPLTDDRTRDLSRAVAQITAVQGVEAGQSAVRLLMADGFYKGHRNSMVDVDPVHRDIMQVYGRGDTIAFLEPDLIGEHLIGRTADALLIDSCLAWIDGEPEGHRTRRRKDLATVLQRATQPDHGPTAQSRSEDMLGHVIRMHGVRMAPTLVATILDTPGTLKSVLHRCVRDLRYDVIRELDSALPLMHLDLLDIALVISEQHVSLSKARVLTPTNNSSERDDRLGDYADALNQYGGRLSALDKRAEALTATEEAVNTLRPIAEANPRLFSPKLAKALNNFGIRLSRIGRVQQALVVAEEAVNIRESLVADNPQIHLADLARAQTNVSNILSELMRPEEALNVAREAISNYRRLASNDESTVRIDLALALNNLGIRLSEVGRNEEALAASEEAVSIYRDLCSTDEVRWLPNFAMATNNFGLRLFALKDSDGAIAAMKEAVSFYGVLAVRRPEVFQHELATTLGNLANMLADKDQDSEALSVYEQALGAFHASNIEVESIAAGLAQTQLNCGTLLAKMNLHDRASAILEEATSRYLILSRNRSLLYSAQLVKSRLALLSVKEKLGPGRSAAMAPTHRMSETSTNIVHEFAENRQDRLPVIIVIDASSSMAGERIDEINQALSVFRDVLLGDSLAALRIDICLIRYGSSVEVVNDFSSVFDLKPTPLVAGGLSSMGGAVEIALEKIEFRKAEYRANGISYFRPWLIVISNGEPTDDWTRSAAAARQAEKDRKVAVFPVGVGAVNYRVLSRFSERPPIKLIDMRFKEMFMWISSSISRVGKSKVGSGEQVALPPVEDWGAIVR